MKRIHLAALGLSCVLLAQGAWALSFKTPRELVKEFDARYTSGATVTDSLQFGEKKLPLPAGKWTVSYAHAEVTHTQIEGGGVDYDTGAYGALSLVKLDDAGRQLQARLIVTGQLSAAKSRGWYNLSGFCEPLNNDYVYQQDVRSRNEHRQDCAATYLSVVRPRAEDGKDKLEVAEAAFLVQKGVALPAVIIERASFMSRYMDAINLHYGVNMDLDTAKPEKLQFWSEADWKKKALDTAQQDLVKRVAQQGDALRDKIREALDY
ncbi:hypothetical protein [Leeia sp.]|uniref:hypothetical protein n=1 Tax=Leeia sp. TaxID=2884678 RepID=UPI0035AFCD57